MLDSPSLYCECIDDAYLAAVAQVHQVSGQGCPHLPRICMIYIVHFTPRPICSPRCGQSHCVIHGDLPFQVRAEHPMGNAIMASLWLRFGKRA